MIINYSNQEVIKGQKSIFLAGPTPRNEDVKTWRKEACAFIEKCGFDGVVYTPEYSSWKPLADYNHQVMWERTALSNASVIVFWIPREFPDMPGYTTNVEFVYWIHTGKVLYGRPENAAKKKYLDWLYKIDTGKDPYTSLEELLSNAVELANKVGVINENEVLPLDERKMMGRP